MHCTSKAQRNRTTSARNLVKFIPPKTKSWVRHWPGSTSVRWSVIRQTDEIANQSNRGGLSTDKRGINAYSCVTSRWDCCYKRVYSTSRLLALQLLGAIIAGITAGINRVLFAFRMFLCHFVTFHVNRRPREMYCGHARLCLSVCVSVRGCMPTILHGPGCNFGEW